MNFIDTPPVGDRENSEDLRGDARPNNDGTSTRRRCNPEQLFSGFANLATSWAGSTSAFLLAVGVIAAWLISGPLFGFSDTWQLIINSGTSIITFLTVFLIQRSQNKDSQAIHLKLNELIAAVNGASNGLINIEQVDDERLLSLREDFRKLAARTQNDPCETEPHSITELGDETSSQSNTSSVP